MDLNRPPKVSLLSDAKEGDRVFTSLGEGFVEILTGGCISIRLVADGFFREGETNLADRDKRGET